MGGGGRTPARLFWSFFYQVIVPKGGIFWLKNHGICLFFGHFHLHNHQNYYHFHHRNHHFHDQNQFELDSAIRTKMSFLAAEKRTTLPVWGRGGRGSGLNGQCSFKIILFSKSIWLNFCRSLPPEFLRSFLFQLLFSFFFTFTFNFIFHFYFLILKSLLSPVAPTTNPHLL